MVYVAPWDRSRFPMETALDVVSPVAFPIDGLFGLSGHGVVAL